MKGELVEIGRRNRVDRASTTLRGAYEWVAGLLTLEARVVLIAGLVVAPLFGWALAFESRALVVLLVLLSLTPVFVRWPVVSSFGIYAFLVPFDPVSVITGTGGSTLTKLVGLLSAGILLAQGLVERGRLVRPPFAALFWGLLVVWAAMSAAWAESRGLVFQSLPTAISVFLLYLVAVSIVVSRRELFGVCVLAVLGGMAAAGMVYLFADTTHSQSVRGTLILGGQAANPNGIAATLILPLALAIAGYVALRGLLLRAAAIMAVGLIGTAIYMTASRKALVAMIAMSLVFLYRFGVRWQAIIAIAVLLGLVGVMPQVLSDRIEAVLTGEDATGSGRTEIWKVGIATLERFGIFGAGLSNFTAAYDIYAPSGPSTGPPGAHQTYLGLWVELGIIGLALMLTAIACQFRAIYRSAVNGSDRNMVSAIEAACLGMLVIGLFADTLWSKEFWLVWIFLTWAIRSYARGPLYPGLS